MNQTNTPSFPHWVSLVIQFKSPRNKNQVWSEKNKVVYSPLFPESKKLALQCHRVVRYEAMCTAVRKCFYTA